MISDVLRPLLDAGLSLPGILADRADQGTEAMVFLGRDDDARVLPYRDLYRQSRHMASALRAAGMARGEPVILFCDDEQAFVLGLWAVLLAGGVAVPLSAPASYSAGDEALCKIVAVYRRCAGQGGRAAWVLSDLAFDAMARAASWQDSVERDRFVDIASLRAAAADAAGAADGGCPVGAADPACFADPVHGRAGAAPPCVPAPHADELAIVMFSSGSTGDPKGVRLTHRQILSNLVQLAERSELTRDDRSLSWLPLTHDMGLVLFHLCHTLAGIAQYKMTPLAFARDPARLLDHVGRQRISVLGMPNFGFDQLCRAAGDAPPDRWDLSTVRLIYNGAEPIDPQLCRRFARRFAAFGLPAGVVSPGWGIAEASVAASAFAHASLRRYDGIPSLWIAAEEGLSVGRPIRPCPPSTPDAIEIVALGPPLPGMRVRALDDAGGVLPASCLGHLEIQGPNVTHGYFGEPDAEWCATGDIGFLHDGLVYLSGRAKDVLFLNGRNRFSNDIEAALCQRLGWPANQLAVVGITHPVRRVEQVVAFFRQDRHADRRLQAERMRQALEEVLAYPVAGAIGLSALPKTTSGKIRRFALRQALLRGEHDAALAEAEAQRRAHRPPSPQERELAALVRAIVPDAPAAIDPDLPLSRYGLDSVGFMQLAFRSSDRIARRLTPQALIQAGSLARIAALIDAAPACAEAPEVVHGQRVPLTARQQMLWTAWLLDPLDCAYNETYWLALDGALDQPAWMRAAREVIARHPMLHAVVDDDGAAAALALLPTRQADVQRIDCDEDGVEALLAGLAADGFDLRRGPLLRLRLIDTGAGRTVFLSAHHLVTDGWSLQGLISQIFERYAGGGVAPCEPALWYEPPGFANEQLRAWRARIEAADPVQLPGAAAQDARGPTGRITWTLSAEASQAVRDWQRRHGSEFTALAAGLMVLLARLAGVRCPLLGTVASGRHDERAQARIGYFATTLPLVAEVAPQASFASLVEALEPHRLAMLGGGVPDLAELEAQPGASLAQAVRVVYVHQNTPAITLPAGLSIRGQGRHRGAARVDLYISSHWHDRRLVLDWEHDAQRFGASQVAGYAELFEHALAQLLAAPERAVDRLDLLSPAQRSLWRPYQDSAVAVDFERDVIARFEAQARAQPDLPALSDGHVRYSYGALRERVDALCWQLEQAGVARGDRIGLLTDRSANYVIGLLACLKLAAAVMPLDPALPGERIEQIVSDGSASLLLTTPGAVPDEALLQRHRSLSFDGREPGAWPPHPGRTRTPADAAYLIYTSGSTGRPKGVLNTHRCLTNLADWVVRSFAYRPGETICQFAPFSFDVSMAEILPSLCAGLHVHVLPAERRGTPELYLDTMREQRVDIATVTPAYLAVLNEVPQRCRDSLGRLRLLILGGEALKTEEVRRFRAHSPHVAIVNVYGPTETTVLSSAYRLPPVLADHRAWQPLGRPIGNTEIWVLDEAQRACPATVTGTLYIGGEGLCQGYWNDPDKTDAAFRMLSPDGLPPRRFYCSGDLARLAPDGELEFVGRADTQIKLRGFRIELGEIEAVLEQHPGIDRAVVAALARDAGERVLVGYYSGQRWPHHDLDGFLRQRLPSYMVPSAYVHLTEWPLSANRKVDRQRLPPPAWQAAGDPGADGAPLGDTERRLARLWAELLGIETIGRSDHFALLGGSSLSAARLVNRVREQFGRELSLADVMRAPTLQQMARRIDQAAGPSSPTPTRRQADADAPVAASEAQARMVFLDRAHPGTPLNNIPLTLALGAALDEARLREAVAQLARRHRMLRACLRIEPQGVMQIDAAPPPAFERLDAADAAGALEQLQRFHRRAFVLEQGPLWRVALARARDSGRQWLALSLHHAIADGVTLVRVLAELDALYQGLPLAATDAELSYADYVAWQRKLLDSAFGERAARFWADERHRCALPALPHAAGRRDDVSGRQFALALDARQCATLRSLCRQHRVSPFVLMLTLFGFVIGQRCDARRFALGVTLSGRSRRELEAVPGLFVNTVPLAFDWSGHDRFGALAQRVGAQLAELQALQDFPLNRVMAVQKLRDLPFNVLFNEEVLPAELAFGGAPATLEGVSTGIAKLPLLVSFLFGDAGWRLRMEYREQGCPPEWIAGLVQDIERLVRALDAMSDARLDELQAPDEQVMALLDLN